MGPMLLDHKIRRRRVQAFYALWWERFWLLAAPIGLLTSLFLALAFIGLPAFLPGWLHLAGLGLFAGGLAYFSWRMKKTLRRPSPDEIDQRLERDSAFDHQPLRGLQDGIAGNRHGPVTYALWRSHQRRLKAQLDNLKVALPRPNFADRDRFFLRGGIFLLLVTGLFIGGHDWQTRLARAFAPGFATDAPAILSLDAWINPPDYTNAAPFALANKGGASKGGPAAISFPEGSEILARLNNTGKLADLRLDDKKVAAFKSTNGTDQEVSYKIDAGTKLTVSHGDRVLFQWAIKVIPDLAPTAAFTKPPANTPRGVLRLAYKASDDYGLTALKLRIEKPARKRGTKQSRAPEKVEIDLSGSSIDSAGLSREAANTLFRDLTPHPWAGEKVLLTLVAKDQKGQTGKSAGISMILPERPFRHPVARAIIEQRKKLIRSPQTYGPVHDTLRAIAATPKMYNNHLHTQLGLEFAAAHIRYHHDKDLGPVVDLLWDIALGIEDGKLSLAERALRGAQKALLDAMARDASEAEIARLMDELRRAMDRYLTALTKDALSRMKKGELTPEQQRQAKMVHKDELNRMLDQIERMAKAGAKEAARDLLRQLQNLMENLKANPQFARPGQNSPQQQAIKGLQRMMQQQQNLQDRTYQNSPRSSQSRRRGRMQQRGQGQTGQGQQEALDRLAQLQEALRRQLGDLMRRYGEKAGSIPDPLGRAERAMRNAREALSKGQAGSALDMQSQAQQQLARGLRRMLNNKPGDQQANGDGDIDDASRDGPNSRSRSDIGDGNGKQTLPTRMDLQRALEILKELHKRSGDRNRPKYELDYFERLMRRF
jgi:uncharacterized protein (TIGR02302 family)